MMHVEDRPVVLLLGIDRYVMDACLRHDVDAVVVCGTRRWDDDLVQVPRPLTTVRVEDQSSPEHVLMGLHRAGQDGRTFAGVQTTDEFALVTASLLARHFGCGVLDPGVAVNFRDKSLQKRIVAAADIRTAQATVIEDIHDVSGLPELPYRRAVLKPLAGAATAMTSVIGTLDDLRARSRAYAAERTARRTFLLEEYVTGDEWLADGVVSGGEVLFCALGVYGEPCLTAVQSDLPVSIRRLDTEYDSVAYEKALPVVSSALGALGLENGVFHMELFHDAATGALTFSECAARRGGGLIHEELQAKFNVNLGDCALLCALGTRPGLVVKQRREVIGQTYLPGRPGTLVHCPAPADLLRRPGVEFARVDRPYGTMFADGLENSTQHAGLALVAAESAEQLGRRMADVRDWFDERLVVIPPHARPRDLRAWQRRNWPDADFGDTRWG